MKTISLPDGTPVPVLGQGTWKMGEDERDAREKAAALRGGIDLGTTLIDTADSLPTDHPPGGRFCRVRRLPLK